MIHQCFFREDQAQQLFPAPPYRGFGLEPDVNPDLTRVCPELEHPAVRLALVEYAAMLYHWRNPDSDHDPWIGFTSYRQLTKSTFQFRDSAQVADLLQQAQLLSWGVWDLRRQRLHWLTGAAAQAEISSPLLHRFTVDVLARFDVKVPAAYFIGAAVPLANYWAMRRDDFDAYMQWSWPIIQWALALDHPFKHQSPVLASIDQRKAVGYFAERLFAIWAMREGLQMAVLGEVKIA